MPVVQLMSLEQTIGIETGQSSGGQRVSSSRLSEQSLQARFLCMTGTEDDPELQKLGTVEVHVVCEGVQVPDYPLSQLQVWLRERIAALLESDLPDAPEPEAE